jgi:hypothetical protein
MAIITRRIAYVLCSVAPGTMYNTSNTNTYTAASSVAVGDLAGLAAGEIPVQGVDSLALDFTISAISGASAAVTVNVDRKGADGLWYNMYTSGAKNAPGPTSASLGQPRPR